MGPAWSVTGVRVVRVARNARSVPVASCPCAVLTAPSTSAPVVASPGSRYSHRWTLVGRDDELGELVHFVRDDAADASMEAADEVANYVKYEKIQQKKSGSSAPFRVQAGFDIPQLVSPDPTRRPVHRRRPARPEKPAPSPESERTLRKVHRHPTPRTPRPESRPPRHPLYGPACRIHHGPCPSGPRRRGTRTTAPRASCGHE
jgi:hypothetical protein